MGMIVVGIGRVREKSCKDERGWGFSRLYGDGMKTHFCPHAAL